MWLFGEYASGFVLLSLLGGVVPLGLLVLAIIAVVTSRGEADPQGRRPMSIYLAGVLFVALFVAIFAVFSAVEGLSQAVGDDEERFYNYDSEVYDLGADPFDEELFEEEHLDEAPVDDDRTTRAIGDGLEALLVALPAAGLFAWHLRLRRGLLDEDGFEASPAARIDRAFLHATAFTSVLLAVVGLAIVLPDLLALVAPGLTDPGASSSDTRDDALRSFFPYLALTLLTGGAFVWAWRQTPDGAGFLRGGTGDGDEDGDEDGDGEGADATANSGEATT